MGEWGKFRGEKTPMKMRGEKDENGGDSSGGSETKISGGK